MYGSNWNPRAKHSRLVQLLDGLLQEEQRTVRDCYYALEARGHHYTYDEVTYAAKRGRRAGYLDPSKIIDTSRVADHRPTGVDDHPAEWLRNRILSSPGVYNRDFWEDQPAHVEVWLEKASLASVFRPICDEYNVRLEATRGDWSDSKAFEARQRLIRKLQDDKDIRILYFGDYNPSGFRTPVAIQQMLHCYGMRLPGRDPEDDEPEDLFFDVSPWPGPAEDGEGAGTFDMERVALTTEQLERFDLPENPNPSEADSDKELLRRFKEQVTGGADVNVELNALKEFQREFLEGLVEDAIESHIDTGRYQEHQEKEQEHKEAIRDAMKVAGNGVFAHTDFEV